MYPDEIAAVEELTVDGRSSVQLKPDNEKMLYAVSKTYVNSGRRYE